MVVGVVIITQCTMTLALCINVTWCCDEPVSCISRHPVTSILLHCLMPTALAGRVPWLPRWLPFPQDPHTPPPHRPLQGQYVKKEKTLTVIKVESKKR
jgi:hypothetical protein